MEELIVIIVQDQDPLAVNPAILTGNSPVFAKLINELHQTEIDMTDFNTETVVLFLTYLNSNTKSVKFVDNDHFRELHKLIMVFEVKWMKEDCHRFFRSLIRSNGLIDGFYYDRILVPFRFHFRMVDAWDISYSMFVLKECEYMVNKWGDQFISYIDLFVTTQKSQLKYPFLEGFLNLGLNNLSHLEIDVLLQIVQYSQLDILLQEMIKYVGDYDNQEHELTDGSVFRYLLENLNLPLCRIRQPEKYDKLVDIFITKFGDVSPKDVRLFCINVAAHAKSPAIEPTYKLKIFDWMREEVFVDLTDVVRICENKHVESVHTVADFILYLVLKFSDKELPKIDPESIVIKIEDLCLKRSFATAHRPYLKKLKNCLEIIRLNRYLESGCPCVKVALTTPLGGEWPCNDSKAHNDFHPENIEYIKLLDLIKQSNVLSSQYDNVVILYTSEEIEEAEMYHFKHPGVPDCSRRGKCGFVIKTGTYINAADKEVHLAELHRDDVWSSKKSKKRVHCHDLISPENFSLNYIEFDSYRRINNKIIEWGKLDDPEDMICAVPYPLYIEFINPRFDPCKLVHNGKLEYRKFVMYNVADYLVKKKKSA